MEKLVAPCYVADIVPDMGHKSTFTLWSLLLHVIFGGNNLRKNTGYYGKCTKHLRHDEVLNLIWLSLSRSLH